MVILRMVLVIPEFECGTKFRESRESVRSCDSGASRADGFRGGTSARGVTGDVTGLELAEGCQQSHVSVMGRNIPAGCCLAWAVLRSHQSMIPMSLVPFKYCRTLFSAIQSHCVGFLFAWERN